MARTIWNPSDRAVLLERFERLSPAARPRWGSFDAPRMVTHVTDGIRMATGELAVAPKSSPLSVWPVNVLVMFYLPWPKGSPTAPELLERKPADWARELDALKTEMNKFCACAIGGAWAPHPAFGRLSGAQWGRLIHRHLDHHLVQFGV